MSEASGLDAAGLAAAVTRIAARAEALRDALNAADRVLGDGDTGMTVADIVAAWQAAPLADAGDAGAALGVLGRATSQATGSSLGAVVAMGLRAAGRATAGRAALDRAGLVDALHAATGAIVERSGAQPGDKTVLDALIAIADALSAAQAGDGLAAVACGAAQQALDAFRPRESKLGRARMFSARSRGHDDPGMLAVLRVLEAAVPGA